MNAHLMTFVALLSIASTCPAAEFFVAPDGKTDAAGTRQSPWDIASTLAGQQSVKSGDTVWLRGGTYRCEEAYKTKGQGYRVTLIGTADKPIVIRAARGERATIDGGMVVQGDHLWLWDLEIAQPDGLSRVTSEGGSHPDLGNPYGGMTIHGDGCRCINLVIQNNLGNGVGWWSSAKGGEIYGCIIVRNGWKGPDRNHGHCVYTQNREGTKTISNCIMTTRWPGGHYTMHAYGSSRACVDDFVIEDNIAWRHGTFLVGGGRPSKDIVVRRNYLYRVPMQIGYNAPHNENCKIVGNVVFRAGVSVNRYKVGVVRENLIVDGGLSVNGEGNLETQRNTVLHGEVPEETRVMLLPNKYDEKRANLAIFNWRKQATVSVPADGFLKDGDRFRLVDPLDFYGKPAFEGRYKGSSFVVPIEDEFGVFVVLKD